MVDPAQQSRQMDLPCLIACVLCIHFVYASVFECIYIDLVCIPSREHSFGKKSSGAPTFLVCCLLLVLLCFLMQLECQEGAQYKSKHAQPD